MRDNNLDELNEYKYRTYLKSGLTSQGGRQLKIRISPLCNERTSPDNRSVRGKPLIIRSSSLLEDQIDSAFRANIKAFS